LDAYERMADYFDAHATGSAFNAFYDRPAMLDLAGDVRGRHVLDAGAGAGHYSVELARRGARVVAVEGSARMIEHFRRRVGDAVPVHRHDLELPMPFLADGGFDGVVLALVVHHVDRRAQLLRELRRLLRPGGWLVLSTHHPTADWLRHGGGYFAVERVAAPFRRGTDTVPIWRMPLGVLLDEVCAAGFRLDRLVEPRPVPALRERDPAGYERLCREPAFIAFRFRAA
jgi:SAM-dependent methyltransferase